MALHPTPCSVSIPLCILPSLLQLCYSIRHLIDNTSHRSCDDERHSVRGPRGLCSSFGVQRPGRPRTDRQEPCIVDHDTPGRTGMRRGARTLSPSSYVCHLTPPLPGSSFGMVFAIFVSAGRRRALRFNVAREGFVAKPFVPWTQSTFQ